ncbi:MAG: ATP-grasp domain-containing protein [Sporocytophaga sp.]|uniref:ATP-grasp domain-containing protein n=1 Tax=Sporocytophaga sp. TaxID=2231183 RepID=UPI001AFD5ACF|nr:ATP-grasp domain-containing protein [Sporocytophaga sp.]MBO9702357.1 ATP-grasp domain-containing protein [Sporocytophaga sp.]
MELYTEEIKLGEFSNISFYSALEAYYNMGFVIVNVKDMENIEIHADNIFLGSIQFIHRALQKLNKTIPEPLDYPKSLSKYLGRRIWESTMDEIANNPDKWNVFVKPKGYVKKFTGRPVRSTKDLVGCGDINMNTPVWVSEPINFTTEWRVFVRYGRVLGVKLYKGDWRNHFNSEVIEAAISDFEGAPAGYALDFGLTSDNRFLLIEANDGFSLGNYGLFYVDYAKLLSARWAQLTGSNDLCNF